MKFEIISIKIPNPQGLLLGSEIYKPCIKGKMPFVIIFHGFTGYKEEAHLVDISRRLASNGIGSIRFTTAGIGDSEGSLENDFSFTQHMRDGEAVYKFMKSQEYVNSARIGVCGHSMGGKLAVLFAAAHKDIRSVCAISAPIEFLSTAYGDIKDDWIQKGYFEKKSSRDDRIIRVPASYLMDVDKDEYNVLDKAVGVGNIDVLMVAGKRDDTVHWQDSKKIFDALQTTRKQWVLLDDIDHWYKKNMSFILIVHDPIVRFFTQSLQ